MSKITKEQLQDSRNEFYDAIHDSIELLLIQIKKAGAVYYKHDDNFVSDKTYDDTVKILIKLYALMGVNNTCDDFRETAVKKLQEFLKLKLRRKILKQLKKCQYE